MKKSILFTSLIAGFCLSIIFTNPTAANQGGETNLQEKPKNGDFSLLYLPIIIRDPAVPKLVSPENGSNLDTLIPVFVSEAMPIPDSIRIRVDISKNSDFSTYDGAALPTSPITSELVYNLEPDTLYYWRAYVYDRENDIRYSYSEVWSFTTPKGGILPEAPSLISPVDNSLIKTGPVILECDQVPTANGYRFVFQGDNDLITYFIHSDMPQLTPQDDWISPGTNYQWWVIAKNEYGYGDPSNTWYFHTAIDYTSD